MKKNVFISYSRRDSKIADRVCKALDNNGITYFIDRTGISGGLEFPDKIAEAIKDSEVFLFIGSKNSYESRYVANEITYAYNVMGGKPIIPYLIDNTPLPDNLLFIFGNVNYRKMKEHPINTVLINDIKGLLKSKPRISTRQLPKDNKRKSAILQLNFKKMHQWVYAGAAMQIALLLTALIFFCQLLKPGWGYIGKHPGSVYWWATILLCTSLIASIAGTVMLSQKRKKIFYGICGLDVLEAIFICAISTKVGAINYPYQTAKYQLLDKIGDTINYYPILAIASIAALIAIHCYAIYQILKLKHNGVSIWDTMR
jgi:hypothetical protein